VKTRKKHIAYMLTVSALLALACPLVASAQSSSSTTTTLAVTGVVKRGQTITLTAVVSGDHSIYLASEGFCNVFFANVISIYDGDTWIGQAPATDENSTGIKLADGPPLQPTCPSAFAARSNKSTYSTTYTIPLNAKAVNLFAKFTIGSDPYTIGSQSQVYTVKFSSAVPAITSLLLDD
jgi:hypothetical protein